MAGNPIDLESIVREVVRQLQSPSPADAPRGTDRPSAPRDATGTLEVTERVVTWVGLKDRLAGIRRLIVPAGAVLTPSVRDELRKRSIAWKMADQSGRAADAKTAALVIAAACGPYDAETAVQAIAAEAGRADPIGCGHLADMIRQLGVRIAHDSVPGVLVTTEPALAACLANRYAPLRAVWATGLAAVAEGERSLGANLLVLDPRHSSSSELRTMVRQFLRGHHRCPADGSAVLAEGKEP
jgi:hypothetical protein